ncbi:MAG: hypothetical protein WC453_01475 [Patescibacteria group bacterium]
MFKKKKKIEQNPEAVNQLNQDMVVHNMPKAAKLGEAYAVGMEPAPLPVATAVQPAGTKHRTTGIIIMISGVLVIGILVYLSYRFVIAPAAAPQPAVIVEPDISPATTTVPIVETATTTDLATTTVPIDLATTTVIAPDQNPATSSTDLLFPDADRDGLNDSEEALLGISATSTDSDGDAYSDFAEIINGYDPSGSGKIATNPQLTTYANQAFNYEILYPKGWPVQSLNDEATTIFSAPDNSLIQISVQDNQNRAGMLSWYEESFPEVTVTYDKVRSTYSWEGIMGENGLNFYLTDKNRQHIFVISYIPALEGRIAYPTIFQMMINSFFIK